MKLSAESEGTGVCNRTVIQETVKSLAKIWTQQEQKRRHLCVFATWLERGTDVISSIDLVQSLRGARGYKKLRDVILSLCTQRWLL